MLWVLPHFHKVPLRPLANQYERVVEEKSEREETREERGVSIKGKHGGVVLFRNRRYIMVFM